MSVDVFSSPTPRVRRFGRVNWVGLGALYRRQVARAAKDTVDGLLGPVMTNLLFLAVFGLALGPTEWPMAEIPLMSFVAPALVLFAVAERALTATSASILFDKQVGPMLDLTMAPLTPWERVIGQAAGAATAGLMTGGAVAIVLLPLAGVLPPAPMTALFFAAAIALLFGLLGIAVGLWSTRWDHYTMAHSFLFIPPAYFSGMFYPVDRLPEIGQTLVALNPFFYGLDGFRRGVTGWGEADPLVAALLLLALIAATGFAVHALVRSGYRVKA